MSKNNRKIATIAFLVLCISISTLAAERILVIKGGEIHTVSGDVIQKGMILLEEQLLNHRLW